MTALERFPTHLTLWALRLLARLIARYDLPGVLAQDVVDLSADERSDLANLLPAWHVGRRLRPRITPSRACGAPLSAPEEASRAPRPRAFARGRPCAAQDTRPASG